MMMSIRVCILLLFLFSSLFSIYAIYEDQAGLTDWHQRYIGKVKHAVFHTQKAARKRVVVSTDENVVASLDLRHGEIFWRHVLADNDVIDGIDIALGKYVITLSSGGSILRAWNLPDGQMVWESFLPGSVPSKSLLFIPMKFKVDKDNLILVYGRGYIHAVSGIDGEVIWKKDLASEGFAIQRLVNLQENDAIYAVGFAGSSQFVVYKIHTKSGETLKHQSVELPGLFSGDISMVSAATALALDSSRSNLLLVCFGDAQISVQKTPITDLVPYSSEEALIVPTEINGIAALRFGNSIALIKVIDNEKIEALNTISDVAAISDSLSLTEGEEAFGLAQHKGDKIELTVKLINDMPNNLLEESVRMDHQRGEVQKVFINHYIRTDRSYGFRALIVMEDHSLLLIQQGEIVWSREDGLASVIDVTTSELPIEKDAVSVAKVEHSLFEWLKGHLLKLKGTLMLATTDDIAAIQRIRLQSSGKSKMTRDHNGFRKLIIVLTKAGKLFALHSGDGRIVWSHLLKALRKSENCATPTGLSLYQWQVPHHHAMDENPSVIVIGRCGGSLDAPGVISIIDVYTGTELSHSGPSHSIVEVIPLPYTDSTEQRLHVLIDAESHAYLYPRNPEALGIFKQEIGNIYWYSVDTEDNILRGYGLKNSALEKNDDYCFDIRILWSIVFPAESEKILATSRRKLNEVVHTQAKVMTDQEVMYKYISKNVLFVATVAPHAVGDIGSVTPDESWVVIYLIDTVTGRILYRMTHHGSQGPVQAVFSENWVVYHYFNLRAHRYEMSVIEIYDQSRADNKDMLKLVFGKHNLTSPISSYSRPEVVTKSQSYFFTHSVKTMAVTLTAKGVTSKQLLIGTIGDQVLALDKRFLDPRRTLNPTQAEKEEGIIPLTDSLPIIPQSYVTHALKVEGLKGIVTIPAKLESTTLVFAYGVDLFYTRLAPSKTYDSLTEDFSYALLLITIVALVIAIFVTWVLSERKELQEKWR